MDIRVIVARIMMIDYLLLLTIEFILKTCLLLPCIQRTLGIFAFICIVSVISAYILPSVPELK